MDFGYNTFGSIGYGYSDIDYKGDSNGKIQSIHLGLNRFEKMNGLDLRLGLNGEYNFHEVKRDISNFSRRAKADFNSYWIGLTGEVGKTYGEGLYARPFASLELGFGGHESFTERRAESLNAHLSSKNYTSVLPKIGMKVGADMEKVSLYASADFSYEIGNMDKNERFSFEGFKGTASLHRDKLESGLGTFKVGADSKIANFNIGVSGGVQVGRRDRTFGELSIGYRF
jgi:outer membrane autotransporter protein